MSTNVKLAVKRYSGTVTLEGRAQQIWQILVAAAHNRQTVTYQMVADLLGYKGAGILNRQLGHLMYYCHYTGLPALTVLVVNTKKGTPGRGLFLCKNKNAEREKVFRKNWFDIVPPSKKMLISSWTKGCEEFGES